MILYKNIKKYAFCGVLIVLLTGSILYFLKTEKTQAAKYHAVIIQAAGYLPGTEKPEGVDVITHATTKEVNTYVLTEQLARKLEHLGTNVKLINYSDCSDLKCLYPVEKDGSKQVVDLVIFAGPAYYSKLPEQLFSLFPKLKDVVEISPDIICSSLVSAWFPDTKGQAAIKHSTDCFTKAGARTVMGISLLVPKNDKPGIAKEETKKVLSKFADGLIGEILKTSSNN